MARKDSFENALLKNGMQQKNSRGNHLSMYSQMGSGKNNAKGARRLLVESSGGSGKEVPHNSALVVGKTNPISKEAINQHTNVLPKIHRDSTDTSEYNIGGGGISHIGYGSNQNDSMGTIVQNAGLALMRHNQMESKQQHSKHMSHVKSEEAFKMNVRYDISKGIMSPSPDMPPQMLSHKKRSGTNQHYYSNQKSTSNPIEQMSGQTAEGSFIDAPPIPYQKRYMADVRNHSSASTMIVMQQTSEPKFRRNLHHPEQPELLHNSEYYAMAEDVGNTGILSEEAKMSENAALILKHGAIGPGSRAAAMSAQKNSSLQRQKEEKSSKSKQGGMVADQIGYATPHADMHESSSNKEIYGHGGSQFDQLHKSIEMANVMGKMKSGSRRKMKTFSDSSVLNLNRAMKLRISPIRHGAEEGVNIRSQKNLHSEIDNQDQISVFRDNVRHNRNNVKLGKKLKVNRNNSSHNESEVGANQRSNYLFDVKNRSGMGGHGEGSPLNYYQESIPDNYSVDSMSDLCMQIATQALSKCYNIVPQLACQLIADTREQINYYRKQISFQEDSSQNKRVILSQNESSAFFNTISDRFYQKAELIIEKNCDLRPILSMILLGMQSYQSEKTKIDALKCVKFFSDISSGHFRAKIWHWIKYTSIKQPKADTLGQPATGQSQTRPKINVHVQGFIQTMYDLMSERGNSELNMLACRILVGIAQKSYFELFLSQLPSIFTDRVYYLRMINEHIQMYVRAMSEQVDEIERTQLIRQFNQLRIPNFLVAQCLCLIEGNLINQKETQLESFIPLAGRINNDMASQKSKRLIHAIQDQHSVAVSLLTEIWATMPSLFSSPQTTQILQNECEYEDFGLKERLSQHPYQLNDQKRKLLGSKVLSLFKKISKDASLTLKTTIISRLFFVLETLTMEMDDFSETIYQLLVFFFVEWHDNKVVRNHMMSNFLDLFKQDKVLSLRQLLEPLSSIIVLNLEKGDINQRTYLTMADFSFLWDLANKNRITIESALPICQVMQTYMLKRDPQYRGVAEKIFLKLVSKFPTEDLTQNLLKTHADQAIIELANVDNLIKMGSISSVSDMLMKSHARLPDEESSNSANFEMQLQLHYLFKHLLFLARGKSKAATLNQSAIGQSHSSSVPEDDKQATGQVQFRFIAEHIVNTIQQTIKLTPPDRQSQILISLLKKLLSNDLTMPDKSTINKSLASLNPSPDSSSTEHHRVVPADKQTNLAEARNQLGNKTLMGHHMQSHETLLTPFQAENLRNSINQRISRLDIDEPTSNPNLSMVGHQAGQIIVSSQSMSAIQAMTALRLPDTNSSDYEPTRHNKTIISASAVFEEVREIERRKTLLAQSPVQEEPEEDVGVQQTKGKVAPTQRKDLKEIGTEYDPPRAELDPRLNSSISDVPQPVRVESQGIQTNPQQANKKMQVSLHGSSVQATSSVAQKTEQQVEKANKDIQTKLQEVRSASVVVPSPPGRISEKDRQRQSHSDMKIIKMNGFSTSPITHITEVEGEQDTGPFPTANKTQEDDQKASNVQTMSPKSIKTKFSDKALQKLANQKEKFAQEEVKQGITPKFIERLSQNSDEIDPKKTKIGSQSHRQATDKRQGEAKVEVQKQKTVKMDVREALNQIKSNLDSVTANLKQSMPGGYSQEGTTFRTELYSSEGEVQGPPLQKQNHRQLQQEPIHLMDQGEASDQEEQSRQPQLNKYGSKKRILVQFNNQDDDNFTARQSSIGKGQEPQLLADQDPKNRRKSHADLARQSRNQKFLLNLNQQKYLQEGHQSQKQILTIGSRPEVLLPIIEPSTQKNSLRRHISIDRPLARESDGSQSVYSKGINPRHQQFAGLPILLPKMTDFWRGNPLGQTQYGDNLNFQTQGVTPSAVAVPSAVPMQRFLTQMTQEDDDEMTEAFIAHNRRLKERQKQLMQIQQSKSQILPKMYAQSPTQVSQVNSQLNFMLEEKHSNAGNQYGDKQSFNQSQMKSQNWLQGKMNHSLKNAVPLRSEEQRKQEVKRLETALERLLINLGSDQDPQRYERYPEQIVELSVQEEKPPKKHAEDNKLSNTFASQIHIQESLIEERLMDSYIKTLKDGNLGIGSGDATPIYREYQTDMIDIVRPATFDPMHPGLANLSPSQLDQLKILAQLKDDDKDLSAKEESDLAKLLDLIENGIRVDGRHPGMVNLTPEQQQQFLKLYEADQLNSPPLPPDKKKLLNKLKDLIVHGIPLDSRHPGVVNLSPNQYQALTDLEKKLDRGQPLKLTEEEKLGELKNLIAHGQRVDSKHPGVSNLTENQKERLKGFEVNTDHQKPDEKAEEDHIKNLIVHGTPLDLSHPGIEHLSPDQIDKFKSLDLQRQNKPLSSEMSKTLNALQEMILNGVPVDENHPGIVNLTPILFDTFEQLLGKQRDGELLNPANSQRLRDIKNRVVHGQPLEPDHVGMSHLTPWQQTEAKGLIRRKKNGDSLSPDEMKLFQNLTNLMLFGKPLNEHHPGYKNLRPTEQKRFSKLHRDWLDGKTLAPENEDALEKLARQIQLNSGPFNTKHEGQNNMMPKDQETFQELLKKQADRVQMNPSERENMKRLKSLMRPAFPYDRNHPGFENLTPVQQKKLLLCNKKEEAGVALAPEEEEAVGKIKENMENPMSIDENHPGWNNLVPKEKIRFKINKAKEDEGNPLTTAEDADQQMMKEVIKNGRPIDQNHPGFDNLNPEQQDNFRNLFKLNQDGKSLLPEERKDMDKLEDIIVNGIPIDELHPGFKGLNPYQKNRFKNLKKSHDDDQLSPMQKKEFDGLRTTISPSFFSPDLAAALKGLQKKAQKETLDNEAKQQKDRLEELKRCLPHIKENEEMTPEDRAQLSNYLAKRLFEQPMTPQQEEELAELLQKDKDVGRNLTPEEQDRMLILVKMLYKGAELDPDEENELLRLHRKQNKGIGALTPGQFSILQKLKEFEENGQQMNPTMVQSLEFLSQLQALPSQLNPPQEQELSQMEQKNKNNDIIPALKDRLKAFWRMKYHPQLLDIEDRALFYAMKDLESLPELSVEQEDMLFALQKKFNCLPWITPQQMQYMDKLLVRVENGHMLSPQQDKDLNRLQQLPKPQTEESDIPPLSPPECREYKRLKAMRENGEKMTPQELATYRELKDKIKKYRDDEARANASMQTPRQRDSRDGSISQARPIIKTPDETSKKQNRKVTYAPLPSLTQAAESMELPNPSYQSMGPIAAHSKSQIQRSGASPDLDEASPRSSIQRSERKAAQAAFKKAIRRGTCTLKELIEQFFIIEERYMLKDYGGGLRTNFAFAQAMSQSGVDEDGQKPLTLKDFLKYAVDKKIKFKQHHVIEILRGESEHNNIKYNSFVKLLILASCGGDRTKIGISNFKKLMHHMDIFR